MGDQQDRVVTSAEGSTAAVPRDRLEFEGLDPADRLTTLGSLTAAIGHELNNPLTYVIGNLSCVLRDLGKLKPSVPERTVLRPLRDALEGAERIARIVRDMRTLSRLGRAEVEPVDIREALELALRQTSNHIRHRAQLTRHFAEVPRADADLSQLCQVFVNLLLNAAQAMPTGAASRNQIAVSLYSDADEVIIEITDTGKGIPEHVLPRIFDPFFTTKGGEGTGLGLALSHRVVRALRGSLRVKDTSTMGTTFEVRLPRSRSTVVEIPVDEEASRENVRSQESRGKRLLLADDDELILKLVERSLADSYEVVSVVDAREVLPLLEGGERFDLIVSDLMMPDMSGMDLFSELAARSPEVGARMLFMTGGAFTKEANEFLEAGHARIAKPFDLDELHAKIAEALARFPDPAPELPKIEHWRLAGRTDLSLKFPLEWNRVDVVRESCGYFARATYMSVATGQRIALVVHELVENAIRYADANGLDPVEVDLHGGSDAFEVSVSNRPTKEHAGYLLDAISALSTTDPFHAYVEAMQGGVDNDDARLRLARIAYEARVAIGAELREGSMCVVARGAP